MYKILPFVFIGKDKNYFSVVGKQNIPIEKPGEMTKHIL
jgi:hypothetical protein